ncbi:MAG TPA: MOSC N-terminal beta barrel domain-containing protein [Pyrinomonadaceae bacterium]
MELGRISALFRYPVKSMAGELLDAARLGWHGLEGDRRWALRRLNDKSAFPWLSASKMPELLLYKPFRLDSNSAELLPTHVRTPDGEEYELSSDELPKEISRRYGSDLELMNLKHGIFDEASISVISLGTVQGIARASNRNLDLRRFRPNVVLETNIAEPFEEDDWVGRTLTFGMFGEGNSAAAVRITMKDERCVMVNFDPDTVARDSEVMKTVVRLNQNHAGVYGHRDQAGRASCRSNRDHRRPGDKHYRCGSRALENFNNLPTH